MDTKLAGKKGGEKTLAKHGREHFSKIGGYHPRKSDTKKVVKCPHDHRKRGTCPNFGLRNII